MAGDIFISSEMARDWACLSSLSLPSELQLSFGNRDGVMVGCVN